MGSRYLTDLAAVLRAAGLEVVELDGWKTRARGSGGYDSGRPTHVMVHHTASSPSSSGSSDAWYCATGDEDAPLSNVCLDADGVWWVLAAGATNTNGTGGPLDNVPADSMNSYAIGVEANGGLEYPWPAAETLSYVTGVAALCAAYDIPVGHVRAHFEWTSRKIDPAGVSPWAPVYESWDMAGFRADVSHELEGGNAPEPEPEPDEDEDEMKPAVILRSRTGTDEQKKTLFWWNGAAIGQVRTQNQANVGAVTGLYQSAEPMTNFDADEIQRMIDSSWAGGATPKGWTTTPAPDTSTR